MEEFEIITTIINLIITVIGVVAAFFTAFNANKIAKASSEQAEKAFQNEAMLNGSRTIIFSYLQEMTKDGLLLKFVCLPEGIPLKNIVIKNLKITYCTDSGWNNDWTDIRLKNKGPIELEQTDQINSKDDKDVNIKQYYLAPIRGDFPVEKIKNNSGRQIKLEFDAYSTNIFNICTHDKCNIMLTTDTINQGDGIWSNSLKLKRYWAFRYHKDIEYKS